MNQENLKENVQSILELNFEYLDKETKLYIKQWERIFASRDVRAEQGELEHLEVSARNSRELWEHDSEPQFSIIENSQSVSLA